MDIQEPIKTTINQTLDAIEFIGGDRKYYNGFLLQLVEQVNENAQLSVLTGLLAYIHDGTSCDRKEIVQHINDLISELKKE
jgi:hypothetical protein